MCSLNYHSRVFLDEKEEGTRVSEKTNYLKIPEAKRLVSSTYFSKFIINYCIIIMSTKLYNKALYLKSSDSKMAPTFM